jgi:hypothetical protein
MQYDGRWFPRVLLWQLLLPSFFGNVTICGTPMA